MAAGFRSLFAFWLGGASAETSVAPDRPFVIERHLGRGKPPYGDIEIALRLRDMRLKREEEARAAALIVKREMQLMLDEEDALVSMLLTA